MSKPTLKMTHGAIGEAMCCYTDGVYKDADVALTKYEEEICSDEIRKFAEWLDKNEHLFCHCKKGNETNIECVLREYAKEQK